MENLFTVAGEEGFLVKKKIDELLIDLNANEETLFTYDLEDSSFSSLIEELQTVPFLEDCKIIVINNPLFLEADSGYDDFIDYLKHPLDTTFLIINASNVKWVKSNKYIKALELYTKIINIKKCDSLEDYAKDFLNESKVKITAPALEELLNRVSNINFLYSELNKLILYTDYKEIGLDDVKLIVGKSLEDDIYELSNAYLQKNKKKTYEIYQNLLSHNEDSIRIMNTLINKFMEILNTKLLINQGSTKEEIGNYFNAKPGRVYHMMKNANAISLDVLSNTIDALSDLDYQIKSGQIDKNIGLEMFLLKW